MPALHPARANVARMPHSIGRTLQSTCNGDVGSTPIWPHNMAVTTGREGLAPTAIPISCATYCHTAVNIWPRLLGLKGWHQRPSPHNLAIGATFRVQLDHVASIEENRNHRGLTWEADAIQFNHAMQTMPSQTNALHATPSVAPFRNCARTQGG